MSLEELKKCLLTSDSNLSMEEVARLYSKHIMTLEKLPVDVLREIFQSLPYRSIQYFCASSKSIKEKCESSKLAMVIEEKKRLTWVGGVKRPITSERVLSNLLEMMLEPIKVNKGKSKEYRSTERSTEGRSLRPKGVGRSLRAKGEYKLLIPLIATDGTVVSSGTVVEAKWTHSFGEGTLELILTFLQIGKEKRVLHKYIVQIDTADSSFLIDEPVPELSLPSSGYNPETQSLDILRYFFGSKITSDDLINPLPFLTSDDLINHLPFYHDKGQLDVEVRYEEGNYVPIIIGISGPTKSMHLVFIIKDDVMKLSEDESYSEEIEKPLFWHRT